MTNTIAFLLDGNAVAIDCSREEGPAPTTTLLHYLRSLPSHTGAKEGCAEGDCGACTVVVAEPGPDGRMRYAAVNSCLVLLPMIHGKQVITVENLRSAEGRLHPVQKALVDFHGSQCGFCTPGIVMSMFALFKQPARPGRAEVEEAMGGNLCRCTGYRPILEAALHACGQGPDDHFTPREAEVAVRCRSIGAVGCEISARGHTYVRPVGLGAALEFIRQNPGACVLAGATDVGLRVTKKHDKLSPVLDLGGIAELREIREDALSTTIGAGASLTDVAVTVRDRHPALASMLSVFASRPIRNLATLGGNLGTASPIGDMLPILMASRAVVILRKLGGTREVMLDEFVTGYRTTSKESDELIVAVRVPTIDRHVRLRSYKVSKRHDLDIATVSAGMRVVLDGRGWVKEAVIAYGGMAAASMRALHVEAMLVGKPWNRQTVERAAASLDQDFTPISDVRGSAAFRMLAAGNLLVKFFLETEP